MLQRTWLPRLLLTLLLGLSATWTAPIYAGSAGLAWDSVNLAEAYKVAWAETSDGHDDAGIGYFLNLPICGGYYDGGDLVEGVSCVNRDLPAVTIDSFQDDSATGLLWIRVKAMNEQGESSDWSNAVRKHTDLPGDVGNVKRATILISWIEGEEPELIAMELMGLRIEPAPSQ